jgi:hypothetical protein
MLRARRQQPAQPRVGVQRLDACRNLTAIRIHLEDLHGKPVGRRGKLVARAIRRDPRRVGDPHEDFLLTVPAEEPEHRNGANFDFDDLPGSKHLELVLHPPNDTVDLPRRRVRHRTLKSPNAAVRYNDWFVGASLHVP